MLTGVTHAAKANQEFFIEMVTFQSTMSSRTQDVLKQGTATLYIFVRYINLFSMTTAIIIFIDTNKKTYVTLRFEENEEESAIRTTQESKIKTNE